MTSDILSFRRCPRQYGHEAVHGYQPSRTSQIFYGTIIHQVLDRAHAHYHGLIDLNTRGSLPTDQDIKSYFEDVRQSLRSRGIRGARPSVEDQALQVLQTFNRLEGPDLYPRVVDSEHRMQADEETYILHGTVDLLVAPNSVDQSPGACEIWDYKGLKNPKSNNARLRDFLFQMRVYADLYHKRHGVLPARACLYFLNELADENRSVDESRRNALLVVELNREDIDQALREFQSSVTEIESCRQQNLWSAPQVGRGPGEDTCTICDFRWDCPTVRGDRELNKKIPLRYP